MRYGSPEASRCLLYAFVKHYFHTSTQLTRPYLDKHVQSALNTPPLIEAHTVPVCRLHMALAHVYCQPGPVQPQVTAAGAKNRWSAAARQSSTADSCAIERRICSRCLRSRRHSTSVACRTDCRESLRKPSSAWTGVQGPLPQTVISGLMLSCLAVPLAKCCTIYRSSAYQVCALRRNSRVGHASIVYRWVVGSRTGSPADANMRAFALRHGTCTGMSSRMLSDAAGVLALTRRTSCASGRPTLLLAQHRA
jgi:hypothetical protein